MIFLSLIGSLALTALIAPDAAADAQGARFFYFQIGTVIAMLAYLIGSVPFGYIVGKSHGIDIREHGSGNIGATNVRRTLGKGPGNLVFLCDVLKGVAAVLVGEMIARSAHYTAAHESHTFTAQLPIATAAILAGVCCILGHNFPIWLNWKGGKGIATSAGVMIGMMPWVAVIVAGVWAAVFYATGYVSLGSLAAAVSIPIVVVLMLLFGGMHGWAYFYFGVIACVLAVWRHRANIGRLIAGTEPRSPRKSAAPPAAADEPGK